MKKTLSVILALAILLCAVPLSQGESAPRTLRILCIGNSFMLDSYAYVPMLLEEALPDQEIIFGICHNSGYTIAQYVQQFANREEAETYAEWDPSAHQYVKFPTNAATGNSLTLQQILARQPWDVIILHQSYIDDREVNGVVTHTQTDYANTALFAEQISGQMNHPFTFLLNVCHCESVTALGSVADSNAREEKLIAFARYCKENLPYFLDVVPTGTAIQNLRSIPSMESVGANGWLAFDRIHLQHGLGPLCASYAAAAKIMEVFGFLPRVFKFSFTPTDDLVSEKRIPAWTGEGNCVAGITPDNMYMAQKCAMMALKYPFTIKDCSAMTTSVDQSVSQESNAEPSSGGSDMIYD